MEGLRGLLLSLSISTPSSTPSTSPPMTEPPTHSKPETKPVLPLTDPTFLPASRAISTKLAPIPILLSALTAALSRETTCGSSSAAISTNERTVERTRRRRYVPPPFVLGVSDAGGRWSGEREACSVESS